MPTQQTLKRAEKSPGSPNPIDIHVGTRVRLRRTLLGLSQEKLGEALGLTFQQVQKYERGANRIGASRLFDISRVLNAPIPYFFDEMEGAAADGISQDSENTAGPNLLTKRETLELVRAYYKIADPAIRKHLFELARSLSD
jgi:transcriptional regulator with XRE-family HTH domain